jgi:hypothetical protein
MPIICYNNNNVAYVVNLGGEAPQSATTYLLEVEMTQMLIVLAAMVGAIFYFSAGRKSRLARIPVVTKVNHRRKVSAPKR